MKSREWRLYTHDTKTHQACIEELGFKVAVVYSKSYTRYSSGLRCVQVKKKCFLLVEDVTHEWALV
jgi:hypothetical protein